MLRWLCVLSFLAALAAGCALPSRSVGHVSLLGSLESAAKQPLANREVAVMVPAEYGLGAVDLRFPNSTDTLLHQDENYKAVTDANGKFEIDLGDRDYNTNFWLLPPLGRLPRRPPPVYFRLQVPSIPGERYAVATQD